jgi:hypothetical protein
VIPAPSPTSRFSALPTLVPLLRLPTPSPIPSPAPTIAPAPTPPPPPLSFADAAAGVVRRYLGALIAGNEDSAYAALGGRVGDRGLDLKEEAFLDRESRIVAVRSRRSDAASATVEVELSSRRGSYFATYHVTSGPNGPYIDQHDYIRV